MSENTGHQEYSFEFQSEGKQIELGLDVQNRVHDPRIRWQIESGKISGTDASLRVPQNHGEHSLTPYMTMEVLEPRLVFAQNENPRPSIEPERRTIDGEERETIALPEQIAEALRDQLEQLGTINQTDEEIGTDPSKFPKQVENPYGEIEAEKLEIVGWDSDENVMWYATSGDSGHPRPYQIENGSLVWRKHSNAGFMGSKQEIVDKMKLEAVV